jgi:hypothetical protein
MLLLLTSGAGADITGAATSDSITTSCGAVLSPAGGFESEGGSAVVFDDPMAGEARREAAVDGSLLAVRAALRRFSASSFAIRSCSCTERAAACVEHLRPVPYDNKNTRTTNQ